MKHTELIEQAKSLSQQLRDTWNPQVEDAADTIDALVKEIEILTAERELYASAMDRMKVEMQAEVERLNSQQVPDWFKEQVMAVQAERDALKLDAERLTIQLRAAYGHVKGYYMNTCFECHQSMEFVGKRCHTCAACADKRIEAAAMKGAA